jgi:hypothetical protein
MEVGKHRNRKCNPLLKYLGNHTTLEFKINLLNKNPIAFVDALKDNSTLKSLTIKQGYERIQASSLSAIADVMRE